MVLNNIRNAENVIMMIIIIVVILIIIIHEIIMIFNLAALVMQTILC